VADVGTNLCLLGSLLDVSALEDTVSCEIAILVHWYSRCSWLEAKCSRDSFGGSCSRLTQPLDLDLCHVRLVLGLDFRCVKLGGVGDLNCSIMDAVVEIGDGSFSKVNLAQCLIGGRCLVD
jgi:hypothetical protein